MSGNIGGRLRLEDSWRGWFYCSLVSVQRGNFTSGDLQARGVRHEEAKWHTEGYMER